MTTSAALFACGHIGKGQYCHTCAQTDQEQLARRAAREAKQVERRNAAAADPIDLSIVNHLSAVQREARDVLAKISSGVHPFSLDGKFLKSSAGKLLSVPVGRSYRLLKRPSEPARDYLSSNFHIAPEMNDTEARSPYTPPQEPVVCLYCEDCRMQTPWFPVGKDRNAAFNKAGEIWNARTRRPKAKEGDLLKLVHKEISAVDAAYLIDLLSRNEDDWEKRGPIFGMIAKKIADSKITLSDFWPVDTVLNDAARYRKL